jgi:hypothetical protein
VTISAYHGSTRSAKKWATVSTTSLMRQAGERAEWDVSKAVSILRSWSYDHPNAKSAIAIIMSKAAGAPKFAIDEKHLGTIVGVAA